MAAVAFPAEVALLLPVLRPVLRKGADAGEGTAAGVAGYRYRARGTRVRRFGRLCLGSRGYERGADTEPGHGALGVWAGRRLGLHFVLLLYRFVCNLGFLEEYVALGGMEIAGVTPPPLNCYLVLFSPPTHRIGVANPPTYLRKKTVKHFSFSRHHVIPIHQWLMTVGHAKKAIA